MSVETLTLILEALKGASYLAAAVAIIYILAASFVWPIVVAIMVKAVRVFVISWKDIKVAESNQKQEAAEFKLQLKRFEEDIKSAGFINDTVYSEWIKLAADLRSKKIGSSYIHTSDVHKIRKQIIGSE